VCSHKRRQQALALYWARQHAALVNDHLHTVSQPPCSPHASTRYTNPRHTFSAYPLLRECVRATFQGIVARRTPRDHRKVASETRLRACVYGQHSEESLEPHTHSTEHRSTELRASRHAGWNMRHVDLAHRHRIGHTLSPVLPAGQEPCPRVRTMRHSKSSSTTKAGPHQLPGLSHDHSPTERSAKRSSKSS
jgi:hypothetical protein